METTNSKSPSMNLILKAIAVAMGVAALVLNLLGTATLQGTGTVLGLGLACLAIASLRQ
jgi:hypothetical protein